MPVQAEQRGLDLALRPTTLADTWTLSGREQVHPSVIGADAVVLIPLGQSNNNNSIVGTITPTNTAKIYNASIAHRGAVFRDAKPLLASDLTNDHHKRVLADQLITDGHVTDVVILMAAMGGTLSSGWAAGGEYNYRIGLAARCLHAGGLDHLPRIIDWIHGEADTDASVSEATYQANLQSVIDSCKRSGLLKAGRDKIIVHRNTRITGNSGVRTGIRAAQVAVCNGTYVIQGADVDSLDASNRTDGTHFSIGTGMPALVSLIKPYFAALL